MLQALYQPASAFVLLCTLSHRELSSPFLRYAKSKSRLIWHKNHVTTTIAITTVKNVHPSIHLCLLTSLCLLVFLLIDRCPCRPFLLFYLGMSECASSGYMQSMFTGYTASGKLIRDLVCCSCGDSCGGTCGCDSSQCQYGCSPYVTTYPSSYQSRMCRVEDWPLASNGKSYIDFVKSQCPSTYSWQFDDSGSLRYCSKEKQADYDITLCWFLESTSSAQHVQHVEDNQDACLHGKN